MLGKADRPRERQASDMRGVPSHIYLEPLRSSEKTDEILESGSANAYRLSILMNAITKPKSNSINEKSRTSEGNNNMLEPQTQDSTTIE
jgi:hypothetical protein